MNKQYLKEFEIETGNKYPCGAEDEEYQIQWFKRYSKWLESKLTEKEALKIVSDYVDTVYPVMRDKNGPPLTDCEEFDAWDAVRMISKLIQDGRLL